MATEITARENPSRRRGRPRSFDTANTLKVIRNCFAKNGFAGTSIEDLSEATGLSTPSLYNAFGDKRKMFLDALDLEYVEVVARLLPSSAQENAADPLRAYLAAITAGYDATARVSGISLGSALACAGSDPEVGFRLRNLLSALDAAAAGLAGPGASPSAGLLLSTLAIGLCLRSRIDAHGPGEPELAMVADVLMQAGLVFNSASASPPRQAADATLTPTGA